MKRAFLTHVGLAAVAGLLVMDALAAAPQAGGARVGAVPVLEYLKSISGELTVSGIHNREPNSQPAIQTQRIVDLVGRHPGLWSGDFLFSAADVSNRWTMIRECKKQWDEGSIVQILAHVAPPNQPEVCRWPGGVQSRLSDED